jgi:DNA-binding CsgD family transcriptional regulator/tetratricopeptide (TPR) repeat protein
MDLLEREKDAAVLAAALAEAVAGRGRIALVSGEAGIGKSAFVEHFIEANSTGLCVLKGHCDPLFTPTALGPLYDIARQARADLLAALEGGAPRAALFSAVLEMMRGARHANIVLVEDIHWADEATLDLIKFLGRRIAGTRTLLVLTYREDEVAETPLRQVLGDLAVSKATVRLELPRLSLDAVRRLVDGHPVGGQPVDAGSLHRQTAGNPFFVTEVLSAGAVLPPTVRDAVLARAARLGPLGRKALDAAAVIGSRIENRLLEPVLNGALDGLAECLKVGMLEPTSDGLAFRHELVREAILVDLDPARRRELNRLALKALRGSGRRADLAQLVQYAEDAGDCDAVLEYGAAAARAASGVGAHREAAAHYARMLRRAVDRPAAERAALCEAYAEECAIVDRLDEAEDARREAIALRREAGDRLMEGDNLAELAWPLVRGGRNAAADETCRQAIAVLAAEPPSRQLANAYRIQAHLMMLDRDCAGAIARGRQAIALAERLDDGATVAAAENVIGTALLVSGDETGLAHLERSLALARRGGRDALVGIGHTNIGVSYGEIYRLADAERHLAEGMAYTGERDLDSANHYMHAWLALTRLYQGRWSEADDLASALLARPNVSAISRIVALVALGRVQARRGDVDPQPVLDEALALAAQTGTLQRLAPVRAARAEAAWLGGDSKRAIAEASAARDLAIRRKHPWFAGELIYWCRLAGSPMAAPTWLAPPFLLASRGHWRRAAAEWQRLGCPYEQARALAAGDCAAQIEALEIFTRLGAAPASAMLRQRLRAGGIRHIPRGPRATTRSNPFGLTVRELEILRCLATGLTNGGIGAKLHVSPKTVDHHVSSVLAKMGAASRGEAARIARAEHLVA